MLLRYALLIYYITHVEVLPGSNSYFLYSPQYSLDDGSGSMFCTIISLSESKIGDLLSVADDVGVAGAASVTSVDDRGSSTAVASSHGSGSGVRSKSKPHVTASEGHTSKATSSHSMEQKTSSGPSTGKSAHSRSAAEAEHADSGTVGSIKRPGAVTSANAAKTSFFAGMETGQIALIDWLRNKDGSINADSSGNRGSYPYI